MFAGDSFMEHWTIAHWAIVCSVIFLLILIPFWPIVALIGKIKNDYIFIVLIFMSLGIIAISAISISTDSYIKRNYTRHYRAYHKFQKPSTYHRQHYGNDILVSGTEDLTILDIHTHMIGSHEKDVAIYFLANDNTIYKSSFNGTEPVVKIMELNTTREFCIEHWPIDPDDIVVYDNNGYAAYYRLSYENYKYVFNKNETKRINRKPHLNYMKRDRDIILSYKYKHDLRPKIIKERKELQFKDVTPFKVKYEPKLALKIDRTGYSGDMSDSVYVVYKNKKGLYRLRNMATAENKQIQEKVKSIIEKAIVPKWKAPSSIFGVLYDKLTDYRSKKWIMPDVSSLKIKQEDFDKLRVFLMEKPAIDYDYKLLINDNHATVIVTSKEREDLKLIFKLAKEKEWDVVDFYILSMQEQKILGNIPNADRVEDLNKSTLKFYEKEFEKYAKTFVEANNTYDIFSARIKYGVALQCMVQDAKTYDNNTYSFVATKMQKYANNLGEINDIKNIKSLYDFESTYDFNIVSSIEKKLIAGSRWICKEGKSSEQIYQLFIDDYIKLFINKFKKNASNTKKANWYSILKNKHYAIVTYFEKQKELSEAKKELQKIQKEKTQREKKIKELSALKKMKKKTRERLLKQEYYQKIIAERPKSENEEKNITSRIEVLKEKIKNLNKQKNNRYYGFSGADIKRVEDKEKVEKIKKENLVKEKINKEIERINKNADSHAKSNNYFYELKSAMKIGDLQLIQKLLDNGADMYGKPKKNSLSPLFTAVKWNKLEIVKLFIVNGADVNHMENKMLLLSESIGKPKMTKLLLDSGANPNLVDKYGRKVKNYLSVCTYQLSPQIRKDCIEQENLLEAYGYTETREGIKKNMYNIAKTGKDINKPVDLYGRDMSPLEISEYYLYDDNLTVMLLKNGASPHISYDRMFHYGTSFLNLFLDAALNNKQDKLKRYISYGASPNYRHNGGVTSFMKFIKIGKCDRLESMKILLDNGANPNLLDDNGCSLGDGIAKYCKEYPQKQKKTIELLKKYNFDDTVKSCSL